MRVIATLFLAAGAFALPSFAGGEGSCSKADEAAYSKAVAYEQCASQLVNSCRTMCPVARESTAMGRLIVMEMPVAVVDRGELEA